MPLVARPSARVDGFPGEPAAAATLRPKGPTAAASAALAEMPPAAPNGPASARSSAPERPLTPPAPAPPTHSRRRGYVSPPPVIKDRRSDATYTRNGLLGEVRFSEADNMRVPRQPDAGFLPEMKGTPAARFFGNLRVGFQKGGFARCYEILDANGARFAAKVVPKSTLKLQKNKNKVCSILDALAHGCPGSVQICDFWRAGAVFRSKGLLCRQTLMEMLKRRRRFTEPEVRYYMLQILDACRYACLTISTFAEVRPSVNDITAHPFFSGFLPIGIPVSAMHTEPVFMHSATSSAPSTQEQSPFSSALYATEVVHPVGTAVGLGIWVMRLTSQKEERHRLLTLLPSFDNDKISRNSADAVRSSSMPDGKPPQKLEDGRCTRLVASVNLRVTHADSGAMRAAVGKHYYSPAMASGPFLPGPPATRSSTFPPVAKQFGVTGEPGSSPMARTVVGSGQLARVPAGVVPAPLQGQYASSTHVAGPPPVIVDAGTAEVAGHEVDTGDFRPNFAASTASAVGAPVQVRVAGNSAGRSAAFSSAAPVVPLAATTQQEVPAAAYVGLPPRAAPSCSARGAASGSGISGPAQASSGAFGTHGVLENMLLHITSALAERKNGRSEQVVAAEMGELRWRSAADVQSHAPKIFISKWIDYSNKYGLGYQLTDGSVGVYFNDSTSIVLAPDEHHFEYLYYMRGEDRTYMHRQCHVLTEHPPELTKKVTLLKHFRGYMTENLFKAPAYTFTDSCKTYDLDFLTKYLRTKHAVVFRLSNRVVQLNFFDHTKLILSLDGRLVTYIDRNREMATWTLGQVLVQNCHELLSRIRYAKDILEQLIAKRTKKSARATLAAAAVASGRVPDGGGAGRDAVDAVADRLAECRIGNSGS
ncbi:MAG: hypothetical protein BJ554DRAFT_2798 [Olpidium bornovanus]|uniref:POLO box domain-containing protein n=1 Tax=Olpidium bornovanus TaxID=278681 RepID=A0A8H7ZQ65_9FUNG|nr:MAG: hypothetical protein BJ554DRAFT_2798 [Olpidium bornovanus]